MIADFGELLKSAVGGEQAGRDEVRSASLSQDIKRKAAVGNALKPQKESAPATQGEQAEAGGHRENK
jgi:hypothetical protein